MEKRLGFQFQLPKPPKGPLYELSFEEIEQMLLQRLQEERKDPTEALWELARFYSHSKQHEKAIQRLRELMQRKSDPEDRASYVLAMGQTMEQVGEIAAAIRYYKEAEALEPADSHTWYFINNNLGFCLNTLERFAEGEIYCRRAIQIDSRRHNAYKNLGLSLAGQGKYPEAARCFVAATQANAADARAFNLLEELLEQHPELEFDFGQEVDCCRKAVAEVRKRAQQMQPVIHGGWRKQLFLLKMKIRSVWRRLRH
jgi:tetratricopeptide (TPR) repeat protein